MSGLTVLVHDARVLEHRPPGWDPEQPGPLTDQILALLRRTVSDEALGRRWVHPERPERITAVMEHLEQNAVPGVAFAPATIAPSESLQRVHTPEHLGYLDELRGRTAWVNVDTTAVSPGSIDAAEVAAGAVDTATDSVCRGEARNGFALIRPPGHHASAHRAQGFCLLNNIAIAAAYARHALGLRRILVVDWDAHHGNGTQEIFYDDPGVLFFDIHRAAPYYPGSGALEEIGAGEGEGMTVNVPLPAGVTDRTFLRAFDRVLAPRVAAFRPELVLASAGFDAHVDDLAMAVTEAGFAAATARLMTLADRYAGGRLVMALEGGYNTAPLARNVHACLSVLAGTGFSQPEAGEEDAAAGALEEAVRFHER